jgi:hypothetical protein
MECVNKKETQSDWGALEDIKERLNRIEQTQQTLLQHQMELELEMVCNNCGRTIPEGSETCTYCSATKDEDFMEDDRDYDRRREEEYDEPQGSSGRRSRRDYDDRSFDDDDDWEYSRRRGRSVDDLERDLMDFGNIERIPVRERRRDYVDWDGGSEDWNVYDNYDPTPGSRRTYRDNYDPSPTAQGAQPRSPEVEGPPPPCPSCYRPLTYVQQYDAYYCKPCNGYLDMSTKKLVKVESQEERKRGSSKRFKDSDQKLEDVVSYIEYDPDKEPRRAEPGKGKKKKGIFGFGKKK